MSSSMPGARGGLASLALALTVAACGDAPSGPQGASARQEAVKFWETGASVAWNATARDLLLTRPASPVVQARLFAYLSVAQYNAIVAAEVARRGGDRPSVAAAAGAASLVVLKSFFPLDEAALDQQLALQRGAAPWPGAQRQDFALGESLGREIGAAVVAYAATDRTGLMVPPPNPGGPGNWTGTNPIRGLLGVRTFALTSDDQFRPGPPPGIETPEFADALADLHALSDAPSPAQLAIAQNWNTRGPGWMNEVASALIVSHRSTEREAARVLALANMAIFDATDACFDAKFAYYFIRPVQLDPTIKLWVAQPNHPSYPSGHSCQTSAIATVLMVAFPEETGYLASLVEEAGFGRMYGGIHYRFDCTVGQQLGRDVAEWVMQTAPVGHGAIPLD